MDGGSVGAGCGNDLAVGVILIAGNQGAAGIYHVDHIALEIQDVVIPCAVVLHGIGPSSIVVDEVQRDTVARLPQQLATGIEIFVGSAVCNCLTGSQSGVIVAKGDILPAANHPFQLPSLLPGHSPGGAIIVGSRVAGAIINQGNSVELRQLIPPGSVTIGIGIGSSTIGGGLDVAHGIVGVSIGLAAYCLGQLALVVVGVLWLGAPSGAPTDHSPEWGTVNRK